MENKSNEATTLRPNGDRLLDAPLVEIDLNKFIVQLQKETIWVNSDRNSITVFKSDHLSIVLIGLHANAELKTHTAKGHIIVQVLDGEIQFSTKQQNVFMEKGQMITLKENIPHSVMAIKESFFLLTMMSSNE